MYVSYYLFFYSAEMGSFTDNILIVAVLYRDSDILWNRRVSPLIRC